MHSLITNLLNIFMLIFISNWNVASIFFEVMGGGAAKRLLVHTEGKVKIGRIILLLVEEISKQYQKTVIIHHVSTKTITL